MSVDASAVDENNAVLSAPFIEIHLVDVMVLVKGVVKADATAIAAAKATSLMIMLVVVVVVIVVVFVLWSKQ